MRRRFSLFALRPVACALVCSVALGCAIGVGLLRYRTPVAVAASTHEWGLSFQQADAPPVPNLSAEQLRPYNAYYCAQSGQKRLYLTFDAGYENGNTAAILDALKKHNAPAAFFVVGSYVRENPTLIQRMAAEGHTVGNHTMHHPDMSQKDEAAFRQELTDLADLYLQTTGQTISPFYRPPEGKFSTENLQWAQEMGYQTVFWSLAYVDWNTDAQPSAEQAFAKLLPRTHDGAIVLLHSTSATNAAILDELLTRWEEQGYTFGSLDEILPSLPEVAAQTALPTQCLADTCPCQATAAQAPYTIAVDAGHGGFDTGAQALVDELTVCNTTAEALITLLTQDPNYTPLRTRPADGDRTVQERAETATAAGASLLISIHANCDKSATDARGFECFPTPPGRTYSEESMRFAQCIAQQMEAAGHRLRGGNGIRFAYYNGKSKRIVDSTAQNATSTLKSFGIVERPQCPAVLVEQCFLTNAQDTAAWASPQGCATAAQAYYRAICTYFGTTPTATAA